MDIYGAIFAAQGELHGVVRDAKNPHFKNRYATLEQVIETIKPALRKHGVGFMQLPGLVDAGMISIRTMFFLEKTPDEGLAHLDFITSVPLPKTDPQGLGSAITYGCRYALMAALGLPPVDDDGNAGSVIDTPPVKSSYALKKENPGRWNEIEALVRGCKTLDHLRELYKLTKVERATWPSNWLDAWEEEVMKKRDELEALVE